MSNDELFALYQKDDLTDLASSVLLEILGKRGISKKRLNDILADYNKKGEQLSKHSSRYPNVWLGLLGAAIGFALINGDRIVEPSKAQVPIILLLIIALAGWLYWLFCVYPIHWILAEVTDSRYPIYPKESAGNHVVPVYNLYWIFKWTNELRDFLSHHAGKSMMVKGLAGLLILLGLCLSVFDAFLGLLIEFSALLYIVNKMRQVVH